MNIEKLEAKVLEAQEALKEAKAELEKAKNTTSRYRAKNCDRYWYLTRGCRVDTLLENGDPLDSALHEAGNYYKTEEEAEKARDRQLATVRVLDKLRELEGDYKFSKGTAHYNYYSGFDPDLDVYVSWSASLDKPIEWYSTEEAWEYVIDNMEPDLRLMLGLEG